MFTFKGISTKEMRIIVEEPDNLIAKAPIRHEILNIEGRDDAIYYPLGRSPIEISLTLQLLDPSKVDQVLMWLDGEGELIYKDRKTKARIFSEVQPIRTSGIRLINIDVVRAPYWDIITDDCSKPWGANLIPNGWDSFEPFGNVGEETKVPLEVFEEGYGKNEIRNGDFESHLDHWISTTDTVIWEDGNVRISTIRGFSFYTDIETKAGRKYYVVVKGKSDGIANIGCSFRINNDISSNTMSFGTETSVKITSGIIETIEDGNRFVIYRNTTGDNIYTLMTIHIVDLTTFYGSGKEPDLYWCRENLNNFYKNWKDIPEKDKSVRGWDNMAFHMTPLASGLTRIRTWGGNTDMKLEHGGEHIPMGVSKVFTAYVEAFKFVRFWETWVGANKDDLYPGEKRLAVSIITDNARRFRLMTLNQGDNLDLIAGTPTIVEGDKPPTWEADEFPRIVNEGNAVAKPLIKLTKGTSTTCEFEVNGVYFKYHFNQDNEVVIDCEKMEASDKGQLRNRHLTIGYEFPKLDPGPNVVKTISGDAIIEFKRKDRWL